MSPAVEDYISTALDGVLLGGNIALAATSPLMGFRLFHAALGAFIAWRIARRVTWAELRARVHALEDLVFRQNRIVEDNEPPPDA